MWWIIGLGAFALIVFLFTKIRSASHHLQLVNAAQSHLQSSLRLLNIFDREIDERVWRDPYLLGYAQGSIALMTAFFAGNRSTLQKGMIFLGALKGLLPGRYSEVCDLINRLSERHDPEFQLGMRHGGYVSMLMANRPTQEALADPDVQTALRRAPGESVVLEQIFGHQEVAASGPYQVAGAALMSLYMKRHKEMAGL